MPIYEYVCNDCKLKFEARRPMSQATEGADCPKCGKKAGRVFSRFAHCGGEMDFADYAMPSGGGGGCASCSSGSCSTCGM